MFLRPIFAVVAFLAAAAPATALAQDAPAVTAAPETPPSPEEAAFLARSEAFQARLEGMNGELEQAMADPATDDAGKTAATNAIIERYRPEMEAFAGELETFLRARAERPENAEDKAELLAAADAAPSAIRGIPDMIRSAIAQALAAPPAAPQ